MKKLLPLFLAVASATTCHVCPAQDVAIITDAPAGDGVEYYADFRNYQNVFEFVWDNHSEHTIVFAPDNKVYIPNVLMRNTMASYVVGTLDPAARTVTVAPGQAVYKFPNIEGYSRLYMLNGAGSAVDSATGEFNTEPLVFDLAEDGTMKLRTSDAYPMFGLAGTDNDDIKGETYGEGAELVFSPKAPTEKLIKYYNMSYINDKDDETYSATVSGYTADGTVWFRGFDPRYPEAWVKAVEFGDELRAPSLQLVSMSKKENPTVMAASKREMNDATFEYEYTHALAFVINHDKDADEYTAFTDKGMFLTNLTSYDEETADVYQAYYNFKFTPISVTPAVPVNPVFDGYDPAPTETSPEVEFKFYAYPKGTDGQGLLKDALWLRYYLNDEVYTFHKSVYTSLTKDLTLVPVGYKDGSAFYIGSDGEKHYTYFRKSDLPADLHTIGVELIYTIDGVTNVSERLVYDVTTGTSSYAGVDSATVDSAEVVDVEYYDLAGRRIAHPGAGVAIRVERLADGTSRTSKQLIR